MKILITGIGTTGKSTLRRQLVKMLRTAGQVVWQYDADEFKQTRCSDDADCRRPEEFRPDVFYIIEDVRGTVTGKSYLPISAYDLVIYVWSDVRSHTLLWLLRLWRWFQNGYFAWDRDTGWKGTHIPYDLKNLAPIAREFLKEIRSRRTWIKEDMRALEHITHVLVRSSWSPTKISWKM